MNFTCHQSRVDPSLAVVNLDLNKVRTNLFYSLAIPIPCLFFALIYIVVVYKFVYKEPNAGMVSYTFKLYTNSMVIIIFLA